MGAVEMIRRPIEAEMDVFEKKFRDAMSSGVPLLDRVLYYIVRRKGKQMRPMFVFLTAKMLGGEAPLPEATYRAATLIELGHTASLVHDDVVDESDRRRNFFSVNAVWKNKIAVLVGDYMLTQALTLAAIAPYADSPVEIRNITHIRKQESDRIHAIVSNLRRAGISCEEYPDGVRIKPGQPKRCRIETFEDHRVAMAFAVMGLGAEGIVIENPGCCRKTFENYFEILDRLTQESGF